MSEQERRMCIELARALDSMRAAGTGNCTVRDILRIAEVDPARHPIIEAGVRDLDPARC